MLIPAMHRERSIVDRSDLIIVHIRAIMFIQIEAGIFSLVIHHEHFNNALSV
jgi:hypothetical protein